MFQEFYGELGKEQSNIWRRTLAGRLISSFSPDLIFLFRNNPDRFHPNLIMQMLASNFKCRDRTRIAELRSTLSSIKVDQFDGVRDFCNNILSCTRELKLLGGSEVTSEYIFNLLLNRLTPEFNPIIVILEDKLDDKNWFTFLGVKISCGPYTIHSILSVAFRREPRDVGGRGGGEEADPSPTLRMEWIV